MSGLKINELIVVAAMASTGVSTAQAQYAVLNMTSSNGGALDTDANLVNPWGLAANPAASGVWWVANVGTGTSTLYTPDGTVEPLVVLIPSAGGDPAGTPTGIAFNGGRGFVVTNGAQSGPAAFLYGTQDGTIAGWSPAFPVTFTSQAVIVVDESASNASYTGLAIANNMLVAADFANAEVDLFDSSFNPIEGSGAFEDLTLPAGYAPFNIRTIGDRVYVTYALSDGAGGVSTGLGNGFVNVFDVNGVFVQRLVSNAELNAPYGVAEAPPTFGQHANRVLVANLGDGRVNAYHHDTGGFHGYLLTNGAPVEIAGLHDIAFGTATASNTLFFTAGDGDDGLFGTINVAGGGTPTDGDLNDDDVVDGADLGILLANWGDATQFPAADFNGDGQINGADLGNLLANWTP
jgi:uncharacterized protein (TIGR03118 family)